MADGPITQQQAGGAKVTQVLEKDHHLNGIGAPSPASLFVTFLIFGAAAWIFTQLQIASTEQAVFGLLQSNVIVKPGMTPQQVADFINSNMDRNQTIAYAIGWGVQLFMLMIAFPGDRALLLAHKKYGMAHHSASIAKNAELMGKAFKFVLAALVGGDIITDFLYVVSGHNLTSGSILGIIPNVSGSGAGVLLVALLYPTAVCGVTIFCSVQAFRRLEALISHFFPGF